MDTTLVINPGSSSKKYALFEGGRLRSTITFERTRDGFGKCLSQNGVRQKCEESTEHEFGRALAAAVQYFTEAGMIASLDVVNAIGVRIVAPGTYFTRHRPVDDTYIEELKKRVHVTPLHMPLLLEEIRALRELFPKTPIIGVSDSAFHATMPPFARQYSIPRKDAEQYDLYRFGYHGLSVASVARRLPAFLDSMPKRTIVCHIGSGVSVTALYNGVSVDTSMGFSPLSGLMMGTRAGDIDPGALAYLLEMKDLDDGEAQAYLSTEGGLKGLLGAADLRIALDRRAKGDPCAAEAITLFFSLIKKQIGALSTVLGGIDALVLTATASERNPGVRTLVCSGLSHLDIDIDAEKNEQLETREGFIEKSGSPVSVLVLHTDEMGEIARVAKECASHL